jgi:hypothetical protein
VGVLGLEDKPGKAARKGTCVHKALELLARRKLAEQNGDGGFYEPEVGREFARGQPSPEEAIDVAYGHYAEPPWTAADRRDCEAWMREALGWGGGEFSPLKREIVAPERYFDITVPHRWAAYSYDVPGVGLLRGQLAVRGTMDLVTRVAPGVLEYIDWKTGRRLDWATGKEKTIASLRDDPQFLLYYYALRKLYPGEEVIFTVFYTKDGGPFTVCFGEEDLPRAEAMIRSQFEKIRGDSRPRLIAPSWKCERLCRFFRDDYQGSGQSTCEHFRREVVSLGVDRVTAKYADLKKAMAYGDGGGVTRQ